jgi:hypothetical protein
LKQNFFISETIVHIARLQINQNFLQRLARQPKFDPSGNWFVGQQQFFSSN